MMHFLKAVTQQGQADFITYQPITHPRPVDKESKHWSDKLYLAAKLTQMKSAPHNAAFGRVLDHVDEFAMLKMSGPQRHRRTNRCPKLVDELMVEAKGFGFYKADCQLCHLVANELVHRAHVIDVPSAVRRQMSAVLG